MYRHFIYNSRNFQRPLDEFMYRYDKGSTIVEIFKDL